jgi:hypothetical protein
MTTNGFSSSRHDSTSGPGRSEKVLYAVLSDPAIRVVKSCVALDLAHLRWAYTDDAKFARSLEATAKEIRRALQSPRTFGRPLAHELAGWRRSAFPSTPHGDADLRLVFRPRDPIGLGVDIIAFLESGGGLIRRAHLSRCRSDLTMFEHASGIQSQRLQDNLVQDD